MFHCTLVNWILIKVNFSSILTCRMLNVKIRGLESTIDKMNFEKTELSQEKDQLDKEVKIIDDQRRRLDVTNRLV